MLSIRPKQPQFGAVHVLSGEPLQRYLAAKKLMENGNLSDLASEVCAKREGYLAAVTGDNGILGENEALVKKGDDSRRSLSLYEYAPDEDIQRLIVLTDTTTRDLEAFDRHHYPAGSRENREPLLNAVKAAGTTIHYIG